MTKLLATLRRTGLFHDATSYGPPPFTCALKNHFGSVYFPLRQLAHTQLKTGGDGKEFFDRALAEYADSVRPELNIADCRQIMIHGGLSLCGKAEVKSGVNKMIFCGDMVATDTYCSQRMLDHGDCSWRTGDFIVCMMPLSSP